MFLNITNIQWLCSLLLLGSVFVNAKKIDKAWSFLLYLFISIAALSSPTLFIVLPLCLLRLMLASAVSKYPGLGDYCLDIASSKAGLSRLIVISAIYCLAAMLQIFYLTSSEFKSVESPNEFFLGLSYWFTAYKVLAYRVLAPYFNHSLTIDIYMLLYCSFTLLTLSVAFFKKRYFFHQLCFALFVLGLSLLIAMKFKTGLLFLSLQDTADRYFYLPKVLLLWQLLLMFDKSLVKGFVLLGAVALLFVNGQDWTRPERVELDWQKHVDRLQLISLQQVIRDTKQPTRMDGRFY